MESKKNKTETERKRPLRVKEVACQLGIDLHQTYRLIQRGLIPSIKLGGTILVPAKALDDLLDVALANGGHAS